jgi:SAM-dependent methyltransferase
MENEETETIEARELRSWEAYAPAYADVLGVVTALGGQYELALELGRISSADRVLDVGCGPGQLTALLDQVAGSMTGIDFAPRMIEEARNRFPQIDFQVANTERLPFGEASFDVVVCSYVAHHLARPAAAFREMYRVIAPGGRLVVISPLQEAQVSLGILLEALNEAMPDQQGGDMFPSGPMDGASTPDSYVRALLDAGFVDVSGENRVKPLVQADLSRLRNSLWQLAGLDKAPDDVQGRIEDRIEDLSRRFRLDDGSYSFPDKVIACVGHRSGNACAM